MKTINFTSQYLDLLHFERLLKENHPYFTTISGRISTGNYASFNLGIFSEDGLENVKEKRSQLCAILEISSDNLFIPCQAHSNPVCVVNQDFLQLSSAKLILMQEAASKK